MTEPTADVSLIDQQRQQKQLHRWRRWVPIVHWAGTLLALAVGIGCVVTLPILTFQQLWYWLYRAWLTFPALQALGSLPAPFSLADAVLLSGHVMRYAMLIVGIVHFAMPAAKRSLRQSGLNIKPLPKEHPAQVYVTALCKKHRVRAPRVYVTHTQAILAYAVAAPLRRPAVVISDGLLTQAPADVSRWVLAHEVAHLYYGDCRRSSLWMVGIDSLLFLDRVRVTLTNLSLRLIGGLPIARRLLIPFVGRPLSWVSRVLGLIARIGYRVAVATYLVFDRWVSRQCEYRADMFAASQEGVDPGIRLMTALTGSFEPQFNIMATHPVPSQRIAALQMLAPIPDTQLT